MESRELKEKLARILPPDREAMERAGKHWHGVCKPLGSLGDLEEQVIRLAGIQGTEKVTLNKRCAMVVCADNGVVAEGVTQSDSSVSSAVALEIANGRSNINIMAKAAGADTFVADVGLDSDIRHPELLFCKIARGTANLAEEPAMTREQACQAILTGMDLIRRQKSQGYEIVVTGEMGIGNTTTSSAIAAVLLNRPAAEVTGRGAGLSTEGLARKTAIIEKAIALHRPDRNDPVDVLSKVGGFDIAAMTGMFLGGAVYRIPVVIDGFISSVAALLAVKLSPLSREYMFASHVSKEPAGRMILGELGLPALIHAGMSLGEGTGGVCLLPLLDIALAEYTHAHRFAQTDIAQYEALI